MGVAMDVPTKTVESLLRSLTRIKALTMNPHWTANRRWMISDIADAALVELCKVDTRKSVAIKK